MVRVTGKVTTRWSGFPAIGRNTVIIGFTVIIFAVNVATTIGAIGIQRSALTRAVTSLDGAFGPDEN
jgi:hypothetical protein